MNYFSMFSGIGGFELGIQRAFVNWRPDISNAGNRRPEEVQQQGQHTCIGYSEIDKYAIKVYERQFGSESNYEHAHLSSEPESEERPQGRQRATDKPGVQLHDRDRTTTLRNRGHRNYGDATTINPNDLPDFDLLVGGFPCQAFSVAGKRKGFDDTRGTLFFDIARILSVKRPRHLVLENVKGLLSHDGGKTFQTILGVLADLGYSVEWQVLNSKDFGVPQNRERIFIIGHLGDECGGKVFPLRKTNQSSDEQPDQRVQESEIAQTVTATYWKGGKGSQVLVENSARHAPRVYSLMFEGSRIRRLTPKECERLQGFPDDWTTGSDTQRYKQCGNAVTVNVVEAVMSAMCDFTTPLMNNKE